MVKRKMGERGFGFIVTGGDAVEFELVDSKGR